MQSQSKTEAALIEIGEQIDQAYEDLEHLTLALGCIAAEVFDALSGD
jgi:hypothetical protein